MYTKGSLKPKQASRRCSRVSGSDFSLIQCILFTLEENDLHPCYKPADPSKPPNPIGLDLPLASLIGIARKRKKILTCTQETIRAKLETTRLIHRHQMTTTRHAKALTKAIELISLLALSFSTISMILAILS
jgi:hypothetical protein